jgi:hypothetical protein
LAAEDILIAARTVSRHLAHLGLNRRRFLDPTGENNREPRRIHARWPGHMVHLEVKKVGVIPDGGGWRARGRGSEQAKPSVRGRRCGGRTCYTYLHTAIDGFSRLAYTEALPDEQARTAIGFTHRARAFFARHGITHVHRLVTDNGACYRAHDFATVLRGARHQRITPYTPRHNGKVERYHRILTEEFLYAHTWTSEQHRSTALHIWNAHYNYHRPHTTAGDQPPATRLHTGAHTEHPFQRRMPASRVWKTPGPPTNQVRLVRRTINGTVWQPVFRGGEYAIRGRELRLPEARNHELVFVEVRA